MQRAIIFVAIIFFLLGSLILVNPANLYVSPDETAAAYFANQFADTGSLRSPVDTLAVDFGGRIHPRSTLSMNGVLVPAGFLGLPVLYGSLVAIVGSWSLWILTPLLTIAAAFALRQTTTRSVSGPIGLITFLLFLFHPAVWYYSARGLMPNVLFVDLLILAAWLWLVRPWKTRPWLADLLAGLALGLAIFVRASESVWIAGALLLCVIVWRRALSWRRLRAAFLGLILALTLLFTMNALTYGHPFVTGYTVGISSSPTLELQDAIDTVDPLPFGFHPREAWRHFSSYGVAMFWWLSVLAGLGVCVMLSINKHRRGTAAVFSIVVLASVWLILMYGSWEIHDNPDPTQITMANSYVRYWLPLYLFSIPPIAAAIVWISQRGRSPFARHLLLAALTLIILTLNFRATFVQGQDGLLRMRGELARGAVIQASVIAQTPPDAIVITERGDKLLFPHRRIWLTLRDETTYNAMPALVAEAPLYYYGITLPAQDIEYLNGSRLTKMGLRIDPVEIYSIETLYRITLR